MGKNHGWFFAVGIAWAALLIGVGCSLKPYKANSRLEIKVPDFSNRSSSSGGEIKASAAPSAIGDFQCLGINITGEGVSSTLPESVCNQPTGSAPVGLVVGLVPITGGTFSVDVPSGPSRKIQVFGVTSTVGCPSVESVVNDAVLRSKLGSPYEVGATTIDLFRDTSVSIPNTYAFSTAKRAFCGETSTTSTMNLEVPIEILDVAAEAYTTTDSPVHSRFYIDPADYDGTLTYSFEIVAANAASARTVKLTGDINSDVVSISVPASSTTATRYEQSFTLPSSPDHYQLTLEGAAGGALSVYSAKLRIKQVGATKTALYYPLHSGSSTSTSYSTSTSVTVSTLNQSTPWIKPDSSVVSGTTAGWRLEYVGQVSNAAATGTALLYNTSSSGVVSNSTVSFSSVSPTYSSLALSDSETNFTGGSTYQVKLGIDNGSYYAALSKAGLWHKITDISKVEIKYRIGRYWELNSLTTDDLVYGRTRFDGAAFSNPVVKFFAIGKETTLANTSTVQLFDFSTNDSATTGSVSGSTIEFNNTSITSASTSSFTPTNGNNFGVEMTSGENGNTFLLQSASITVETSR